MHLKILKFFFTGQQIISHRSLRRTLVRSEQSSAVHKLNKLLNVQVSDTTGDAKIFKAGYIN